MADFYRLITLFYLAVCFPASVFAQSAPVGAIDLAGWIKGADGTYTKAFGGSSLTLTSPPSGLTTTSTALVNTSKGVVPFEINKTASVDVGRIGSTVGKFAKRVGPVAMALATAELICDLAKICNQGGSWFTTNVETLPAGNTQWTCYGSSVLSLSVCRNDHTLGWACSDSNITCTDDAVAPDGLTYTFKRSVNGGPQTTITLARNAPWVPSSSGSTATTDADWTSKASVLNDTRFVPKLIDADEDVPSGVPTLTANQKKALGLDSVPTKDSNGNITGRADTATEIEAVDAGSSDNPGRVIIKETKTTINYDTNNTQISTNTSTSYTQQPESKDPPQYTISFDAVPEATLQTYNVPNTFSSESWGSGTCPPDINVSLSGGHHLTIPTQPVCDTAVMINPFTLLLASIISVYIVAGVRGGSAT